MDNEYIKPRNKVIRWYDKLSYTWQLIAEANYMMKRVNAREERSKIKYKDIVRSLMYYYWDFHKTDERSAERYYKYRMIVNAKYLIKIPK